MHKRNSEPQAVSAAKAAARDLAAHLASQGVTISRAQALEAISKLAGHVDWNTFRAGLSAQSSAEDIIDGAVRRILHLYPGEQDVCAERIILLIGGRHRSGNDMWVDRAMFLCRVVVGLFFQTHMQTPERMTPHALWSTFNLYGPGSLLEQFEVARTAHPETEATRTAFDFLRALPGLNITDSGVEMPVSKKHKSSSGSCRCRSPNRWAT